MPDYLILDKIIGFKHNLPHKLIINGDQKIISIALASILAKVTRDRLMKKYHQQFPQYKFTKHKGYGTKLHLKSLKKHGICPLHRQSFQPIQKFL
jgi:ribonuclease HII